MHRSQRPFARPMAARRAERQPMPYVRGGVPPRQRGWASPLTNSDCHSAKHAAPQNVRALWKSLTGRLTSSPHQSQGRVSRLDAAGLGLPFLAIWAHSQPHCFWLRLPVLVAGLPHTVQSRLRGSPHRFRNAQALEQVRPLDPYEGWNCFPQVSHNRVSFIFRISLLYHGRSAGRRRASSDWRRW